MMRRKTLNRTALVLILLSCTALTGGAGLAQDVVTVPPPSSGNSIITLPPAVVKDYWFTAEIKSGGAITLDGYAPDAITKTRLAALSNTNADSLEIGGGAPKQYDEAVAYGLKLLHHLQEGRFSLRANVVTIKGTARSNSDYEAAIGAIKTGIPDGLVLALAEIQPAEATSEPSPEALPPAQTPPSAQEPTAVTKQDAAPESAVPEAPAPDANAPEAVTPPASPSVEPPASIPSTEAPAPEVTPKETPAAPSAPVEAPSAAPAETPATASPAPEVPAAPTYVFTATRIANGPVALSGDVPADAAKAYFGVVAGGVSTADLAIVPNPPADYTRDATAGLRALVLLTDGELNFTDGIWSLHGKATSDDAVADATAMIEALPDGADWKLDISGPPAIESCRNGVTDFSASHQILFQSGSAKLTDDSAVALAGLATILGKCPEAIVHVEGHTDSDGDDAANLALSVARAEAVIAVLTDKGVAADRLYAVGYGETLPVASNDTAAGKQANRRIVFDVLEK